MINGVKWTERAKDRTGNTSTEGAGRGLSNGDGRIWTESCKSQGQDPHSTVSNAERANMKSGLEMISLDSNKVV